MPKNTDRTEVASLIAGSLLLTEEHKAQLLEIVPTLDTQKRTLLSTTLMEEEELLKMFLEDIARKRIELGKDLNIFDDLRHALKSAKNTVRICKEKDSNDEESSKLDLISSAFDS